MPNSTYLILAAIALALPAAGQQTAADVRLHLCQADAPGKIDLEAAEMLAELIGAPVFAAGGAEVGHVADICFDAHGRPEKLRMTTEAALGFGIRTVAVPEGTFIVLRGAVALDLPPEAIREFPTSAETGCERLRPQVRR
jgi:hypothetical protein